MAHSSFDIIVIGAGIAGASAAAELARTHRVLMLEREEFPGYHATGRSAALFSASYGNAAVRALSRASRDFFHAPPEGFAEHPLVKPRGALHVARSDQLARLEIFAAQCDLAGSIETLSAQSARALCPILRPETAHAALFERDAADVDVHALHQGYLRQFRARGGVMALSAGVTALSRRDGQWRVSTGSDTALATIVVNASGAWADDIARLAGARPLGIQPCRRTALLVDMPQGLPGAAWPMVIDIEETFYLKPDADLLLISPADETPVAACDIQPDELDVAIAIARVQDATSLEIKRIRKKWAGLRSFAPDRAPVIGYDPLQPGFFWLAGQGGYGIQTAPCAAALAAALIRDDLPAALAALPVAALRPHRFAAS